MIASPSNVAFEMPELATRRFHFIECRACGYEPKNQHALPHRCCPKCGGYVWQEITQRPRRCIPAIADSITNVVPEMN